MAALSTLNQLQKLHLALEVYCPSPQEQQALLMFQKQLEESIEKRFKANGNNKYVFPLKGTTLKQKEVTDGIREVVDLKIQPQGGNKIRLVRKGNKDRVKTQYPKAEDENRLSLNPTLHRISSKNKNQDCLVPSKTQITPLKQRSLSRLNLLTQSYDTIKNGKPAHQSSSQKLVKPCSSWKGLPSIVKTNGSSQKIKRK